MVSEITNLKSTSAVGPDEIPAKILKLCTFECAPFSCKLFQQYKKKTSNFPRELKSANVVPVPKTGDSLCKSNYRPISILPAVSKVFERIMQKQINTYFKDKLSPLLGGYKKATVVRGGFRLSQVSHLTKVSEKKVGKKESYCFTGHSQLSVKS